MDLLASRYPSLHRTNTATWLTLQWQSIIREHPLRWTVSIETTTPLRTLSTSLNPLRALPSLRRARPCLTLSHRRVSDNATAASLPLTNGLARLSIRPARLNVRIINKHRFRRHRQCANNDQLDLLMTIFRRSLEFRLPSFRLLALACRRILLPSTAEWWCR